VPNKPFPPGMPIGPGDIIASKYRVEQLIAVGGMGVVVQARHEKLGQEVAIKVLFPAEAEEHTQSVPRFLREARAAAGLKSEHVVRIYDVDTLASGLPYMVMELLIGTDLRRVIKRQGAQQVERAVAFVLQAADAIEEAHARGIIHRDLKPSNLFLTHRRDGKPLVKVLDFGISKTSSDFDLDGDLTTSRAMIGSPRYMSPEQVRDARSVDARTDIWSLGAILYELITGKGVFTADSLPAICAAIVADPPSPISGVRSDVPAVVELAILRCLEKEPRDRFQSVRELADALSGLAPSDLVPSVPAPPMAAAPQVSVRESLLPTGEHSSSEVLEASAAGPSVTRQSPDLSLSIDRNGETAAFRTPSTIRRHPKARKKTTLVLVAVGLFITLGSALVIARPWQKPAVASAPTENAPIGFALRVDSVPPGADVLEGDRVLGKTPFELRFDPASVRDTMRTFRLELAGYEPYELKQGTATTDVHLRALLVASAPAKSATSVEPAASRSTTPRVNKRDEKPAGSATRTPTDIRLER
jgi:serine/threonine protein kinase